jgi:hypothetical protein
MNRRRCHLRDPHLVSVWNKRNFDKARLRRVGRRKFYRFNFFSATRQKTHQCLSHPKVQRQETCRRA